MKASPESCMPPKISAESSRASRKAETARARGKNSPRAFAKIRCKEATDGELFAKQQNFKDVLKQYCYFKRSEWNQMRSQ